MSTPRAVRRIVACLAICFLVASCGDDDESPSTATTATTASTTAPDSTAPDDVCADRDALRTSVDELQGVDLTAEGTNAVEAAIGDVKTDLTALADSAGSELQPEVQDVEAAIGELESAVQNLGSGGGAEAVAAMTDLVSATGTLFDSIENGACGSGSTTTT